MRATLLKTAEMGVVPPDVKVLDNWGETVVYIEDDDKYVSGEHMIVEGDESAVLKWFRSVPWVWLQKPETPPMFQLFEQWHY